MIQRPYWLLIALSRSPDSRLTPLQLQKTLFLLGQNLTNVVGANFYAFVPHHYGPFSASIYRDLETLADEGLLSTRTVPNRDWNEYEITFPGLALAQDLTQRVSPEALDYVDRVADWTRSTPFTELLGAIYRQYPSFAVKSVFKFQ